MKFKDFAATVENSTLDVLPSMSAQNGLLVENISGKRALIPLESSVLICGNIGAGKTVALKKLRQQAILTHPDAIHIVLDVKGEYVRDRKSGDKVLSPTSINDLPCEEWSMMREIELNSSMHREYIAELCKIIFQESIERANEPFFPIAATLIMNGFLTDLFVHYKYSYSNKEIIDKIMDLTDDKIRCELSKHPDLARYNSVFPVNAPNTAGGIRAFLQNELLTTFSGKMAGNGRFSLTEFIRKASAGSALFIEYDPQYSKMSQKALDLWLSILMKASLDNNNYHRPIYFWLDEIAFAGKISMLNSLLNLGREYNVKVICGLQSIPQFREIYGIETSNAIISGLQSQIFMRCNDGDTTEFLLIKLGTERRYSADAGNFSFPGIEIPLLSASELSAFRPGEGIFFTPGNKPFKARVVM